MEANDMKAMREAVCAVYNSLHDHQIIYPKERWRLMEIIDSAFAKPPRNCDRFADELDAQLAFLNEVWLISIDRETMTEQDTYEKWTDEMRTRYGRWLFAPANKKGDDDGSK